MNRLTYKSGLIIRTEGDDTSGCSFTADNTPWRVDTLKALATRGLRRAEKKARSFYHFVKVGNIEVYTGYVGRGVSNPNEVTMTFRWLTTTGVDGIDRTPVEYSEHHTFELEVK
jgi:hypothetical protein